MNINRHNYEEFFLLYVDNELPAAEKSMVETFLAQNPDLQEEMQQLQQSIIKPENTGFENKGQLLKSAATTASVQEQLLLLLDNELPFEEKQRIQLLTEKDEAIKKEWDLLLQTQLSVTDTEIFEDKKSLYRKEDDSRVVPFRWWRIAAAAILISFGLWGTVSLLNRSSILEPGNSTASGTEMKREGNKLENAPQNTGKDTVAKQTNTASANDQIQENNGADKKRMAPENKINQAVIPSTNNNTMVQQTITNNNNLPKPELQKSYNNKPEEKEVAAAQPNEQTAKTTALVNSSSSMNTAGDSADPTSTAAVENNDAHFASFDEEEEDRPRKTRIGGFFKKVKRVLERKTNIKSGNDDNIKIANMSFAMH